MEQYIIETKRMPSTDYNPIPCRVYDTLELSIMQKRALACKVRNTDGSYISTKLHITDIYSRDGAEFAKTTDGAEIRLDFIELEQDS